MKKLKLTELGRLSEEEFKRKEKYPVIIILDNLRSAMNVGAFFRNADALAVSKIYLCGITAKPPHKEITKTAIGATETVEWQHIQDIQTLIYELKEQGYLIVGIEQTNESVKLAEYEVKAPVALVFGNEVDGLSDSILGALDCSVEIEQFGTKHSFNVAVCGGIVLWYVIKQLRMNSRLG